MGEVNPEAVRRSGRKLKAAAEDVKGLDPETRLDDVATAMPDSLSASAATTLSSQWKSTFNTWHRDAQDQGEAVVLAADDHEVTDSNAGVRHAGDPRIEEPVI